MNQPNIIEIEAYRERAHESLTAARELLESGHFDIAASRSYYAAFYAASAALLSLGHEFKKHSAVISAVHQHLVKTRRLPQELGKALNRLFELRGVGDYGMTLHVPEEEARRAVDSADKFVAALASLQP